MSNNRELINALTNCIKACEYCATACLTEENARKMANCVKVDRDCADICSLAIQYLSRESDRSIQIIGICADICIECAEECEKHDHDHCVECAEACRRCEEDAERISISKLVNYYSNLNYLLCLPIFEMPF